MESCYGELNSNHLFMYHLINESEWLEDVGLVVFHDCTVDHHLVHDVVCLIDVEHDLKGER